MNDANVKLRRQVSGGEKKRRKLLSMTWRETLDSRRRPDAVTSVGDTTCEKSARGEFSASYLCYDVRKLLDWERSEIREIEVC